MGTGLSIVAKNMLYMPAIIGAQKPIGHPEMTQNRHDREVAIMAANADESARRRSTCRLVVETFGLRGSAGGMDRTGRY